MCYHNEIERINWLRSTHPNLCLPDMATKQSKFCNTRESSKISDSLDLGSGKKLLRKNERAEAPPLVSIWKDPVRFGKDMAADVSAKKNMPKRLRLKTFAETFRICGAYPVNFDPICFDPIQIFGMST